MRLPYHPHLPTTGIALFYYGMLLLGAAGSYSNGTTTLFVCALGVACLIHAIVKAAIELG